MRRVLHCQLSHAIVRYIANCMLVGRLSAVGHDVSNVMLCMHWVAAAAVMMVSQ
jgi:hypothetical protein